MKYAQRILIVQCLALFPFFVNAQLAVNVRPDTVICPGSGVSLTTLVNHPQSELSFPDLKNAGSTNDNTVRSAVIDNLGNYIVTGEFTNSLTLGSFTLTSSGGQDIYVAKFNSSGTVLWAVRNGGVGDESGTAVAVDANNNVYVAGNFSSTSITWGTTVLANSGASAATSDIFMVRLLAANGSVSWARKAGGAGTDGVSAMEVNGNNMVLTGNFSGTATFNTTNIVAAGGINDMDYYVCRYNATNGTFNWVRRAGGLQFDSGTDIHVDASGNVITTGRYAGTVQFGTTAATTITSINSSFDVFTARYNSSGTLIWIRSGGSSLNDMGQAVETDAAGNVYVMAECATNASFGVHSITGSLMNVLVAYNSGGTVLYARKATQTDNGQISVTAMRKNPLSNQLVVAGTINSGTTANLNFGSRTFSNTTATSIAFVASYDLQAQLVDVKLPGSTGESKAEDVSINGGGNCIIAGTFGTGNSSQLDFGSNIVTSAGGQDGFVLFCNSSQVSAPVYSWSPATGLNFTNILSPQASAITSEITYTLTVTAGSETITNEVNIGVYPISANAGVDQTICAGNTVQLFGSGGLNYSWQPALNLNNSAIGDPIASPAVTTTFTLTASGFGCNSTDQVVVNVIPNPNVVVSPSAPVICAGSSITLTASGAGSYVWQPQNISGASVSVAPLTTTTYTVTGTTGNCSFSRTVTVTVNPNPILSILPSPSSSICSGSSAVLTASGATTYVWNPGNISGATRTVTPTTTTTYTVTGTLNGCTSTATQTITVNANPTITTSASQSTICTGNSTILSASGASTYTWQPGNLSGSVVTASPTATTTYTVTGTNNGCSRTATRTITVRQLPVISISANRTGLCTGQTVTLTASGASSYVWQPGNLTGATRTFTPATTTTYTVTGTTSGCSSTQTITITVGTAPTPVIAASPAGTICSGTSVTLSATGAASFTWMPGNLSGASVNVTPLTTTTYTVTGNNNGCTSTSSRTITVNPTPSVSLSASSSSICTGQNVALTASGANNYLWSTGATGAAQTESPASTTTYTIIGMNGACRDTAALTITVNPLPVLTLTSTASSICQGNSTTLTASGAATYTWMPGNLSGSTVIVSPSATTTYTLTGTSVDGCTSTRTITITVALPASPPIISTNRTSSGNTICEGTTINLFTSAISGNSYNWQPGNLSGAFVTVSPTDTTIYTLTTTTSGNCISTSTVQVNVNPKPVITVSASDTTICSGDTLSLYLAGTGYNQALVNYFNNTSFYFYGDTTSFPVFFSNDTSVTMQVTAYSNLGCPETTEVEFNVRGTALISVTENTANTPYHFSCQPDTISVTVNTPYGNALWLSDNDTLLSKNLVVNDSITTYQIVSMNPNGCYSRTEFSTFLIDSSFVRFILSTNDTVCPYTGTELSVTDPSNTFQPRWYPNGVSIGDTLYYFSINTTIYTEPETFTVELSSAVCPADTIYKTITIVPHLPVDGLVESFDHFTDTVCNDTAGIIYLPQIPQQGVYYNLFKYDPNQLINIDSITSIDISSLTPGQYYLSAIQNYVFDINTTCNYSVSEAFYVADCYDLQLTTSADTICPGNSVTLTASGTGSYVWLPGQQTGSVLTVQPLVTTTYSVIGTEQSGEVDTLSVTVVVLNSPPTITGFGPSAAVCGNTSVELTATGASTYIWQPGNLTGDSVIVIPDNGANTFVVTGFDTYGCSSSDTVTVNLLLSPEAVLTLAQGTICIFGNDTVSLMSSNAASTSFTLVSGQATPSGNNGNQYYYNFYNTTTFRYTAISSNGCTDTAFATVNVISPLPIVVSDNLGNDNIFNTCTGFDTLILSTNYPNESIVWNPFGDTTQTLELITTDTITEVFVEITDTNGCISSGYYRYNYQSFDDFSYSLSPGNSICPFDPVLFEIPNFFAGSVFFNSEEVGSLYINGSDTDFNIDLTLVLSGCNDTQAVVIPINVVDTPLNLSFNLPADTFCNDTSQVLILNDYVTPAGGIFYYSGPQTNYVLSPIDTLNPQLLTPGNYNIYYLYSVFTDSTFSNSCSFQAEDTFQIANCTPDPRLASQSSIENGLQLIPNPTSNRVNVLLNEFNGSAQLYIYNSLGQLMLSESLVQSNTELDLSAWPAGAYQVLIVNEGRAHSQKLIKQ